MYRLGWFSTGRDKAASDLLSVVHENIEKGGIKARLEFVFCNREAGESRETDQFIKLVEGLKIPLVCYSYRRFKSERGLPGDGEGEGLPAWRLDFDREVMKRLQHFSPDLCVLAGYMLILGKKMCQRYDVINLHPAAPGGPTGTWQEVIWKLIDSQAQETGVMMHLVTPELDKGPVVTYCTFSIRGKPFDDYWRKLDTLSPDVEAKKAKESLFRLIRQHGLEREFPLIVTTVKAFSEGEVRITKDKKVVDSSGRTVAGYNLTDEIDRLVEV